MNSETKQCQNCHQNFVIEPEDFLFYDKMKVPPPTWCPECRMVRRLSFRNERYLYKRTCDLCGNSQISIFSPEGGYKIYCNPCWWSDKWDSLDYGRAYDFSRPFFEQFDDLMHAVPMPPVWTTYLQLINSEYNNLAGYLRNCYMVSHADHNEDCAYASGLKYSRDSIDVTMLQNSELCYECLNVIRGYKNFYCVDCENSRNLYFCKSCFNCNDCVGCVNLHNKQYYIFNKSYSKEVYQEKYKELNLSSYLTLEKIKSEASALWSKYPVKFMHGRHNVNSSGDYIYDSKNTLFSYEMFGAEDCKYCQFASTKITKDAYDYTEWGFGAELIYETLLSGEGITRLKFIAHGIGNVYDAEYSYAIMASSNLFGCLTLRNKKFCILNKQYSEDEYNTLMPRIRKHMDEMPYKDKQGRVYRYGEFFPPELSPFTYNESTAHEYFPLTKKEASHKGLAWRDTEEKSHIPTKSWKDLSDRIEEVDEKILKDIILCQAWDEDAEEALKHNCTKVFRLTYQEFQFYRKNNLPLPRRCYNSRHHERTKFRNPLKLWHRSCQCSGEKSSNGVYQNTVQHAHGNNACPNEFETSYAPERPEIVYCEQCYQAEVV